MYQYINMNKKAPVLNCIVWILLGPTHAFNKSTGNTAPKTCIN